MPTYTYRCTYCRTETDVTCRIADKPAKVECDVCGGPAKHRIAAAAVTFRGPGFYSTDNDKRNGGRR